MLVLAICAGILGILALWASLASCVARADLRSKELELADARKRGDRLYDELQQHRAMLHDRDYRIGQHDTVVMEISDKLEDAASALEDARSDLKDVEAKLHPLFEVHAACVNREEPFGFPGDVDELTAWTLAQLKRIRVEHDNEREQIGGSLFD